MSKASKRSNRIPRLWQAVEEFMADRAKKGVSYMGRESKEAATPTRSSSPPTYATG